MDGESPIIIDFDSCKRQGDELGLKTTTVGWAIGLRNAAERLLWPLKDTRNPDGRGEEGVGGAWSWVLN